MLCGATEKAQDIPAFRFAPAGMTSPGSVIPVFPDVFSGKYRNPPLARNIIYNSSC
jgi:hypothetical protein